MEGRAVGRESASWSRGDGHLLQGALYPGPPGLPTSLQECPRPAPWLLLSIRSHQSHTLFLETRLQVTVPSPWWPLPVLCFSCQCWSGPLQAEGVEATWSLHVLSGEELGESPAHNAGQLAGVRDMLPTPLQVDREVMVRTEEGRELPRAGFRSARPGRIYGKPASGIGAVDQVGGNRGGPWAPAPGPTT